MLNSPRWRTIGSPALLALSAVTLALAAPARAQPDASSDEKEQARERAHGLDRRAAELMEGQRFAEAVSALREANEAAFNPRRFFNIAIAYDRWCRVDQSIDQLHAFIEGACAETLEDSAIAADCEDAQSRIVHQQDRRDECARGPTAGPAARQNASSPLMQVFERGMAAEQRCDVAEAMARFFEFRDNAGCDSGRDRGSLGPACAEVRQHILAEPEIRERCTSRATLAPTPNERTVPPKPPAPAAAAVEAPDDRRPRPKLTLDYELLSAPAAQPPAAGERRPATRMTEEEKPPRRPSRPVNSVAVAGALTFFLGLASLGGGIALGVEARNQASQLASDAASSGQWSSDFAARYSIGKQYQNGGLALDAVGGVAALVGGILWLAAGLSSATPEEPHALQSTSTASAPEAAQ